MSTKLCSILAFTLVFCIAVELTAANDEEDLELSWPSTDEMKIFKKYSKENFNYTFTQYCDWAASKKAGAKLYKNPKVTCATLCNNDKTCTHWRINPMQTECTTYTGKIAKTDAVHIGVTDTTGMFACGINYA